MEMRVRMDCEGCESKVRRAVEGMKGIHLLLLLFLTYIESEHINMLLGGLK